MTFVGAQLLCLPVKVQSSNNDIYILSSSGLFMFQVSSSGYSPSSPPFPQTEATSTTFPKGSWGQSALKRGCYDLLLKSINEQGRIRLALNREPELKEKR